MLPKFFFLVLLTAATSTLSAQAENFRAFEWDVLQLGFASPIGQGYVGGLSLGTEVRYNVSDRISAGLNFEMGIFGSDVENEMVDVGVAASYTVTGDYYFVDDRAVRPFAGFGVGLYGGGTITVDTGTGMDPDPDDVDAGNSFGISPRIGVELGHLRLALEYNLAFGDKVPSYIGFTIAPTLWGGLK